jgi:sensor c-di-GMP phosphodiesterase-like protein
MSWLKSGKKRLMAIDPATVSTVLSVLPTIFEQANKTIEKYKASRRKEAGGDAGAGATPEARLAELETTVMQQAQSLKLLAEQHAETIAAIQAESRQLRKHLKFAIGLAIGAGVLAASSLIVVFNLLR